ncbi:MAG: TIM-barrel domain-containing protein [Chitinophagaceae bacterium]
MKKFLATLCFVSILISPAIAQDLQTLTGFKSSVFDGKQVLITAENGYIRIVPFSADIIEVTYQQKAKQQVLSYSTTGKPQTVKVFYKDKGDQIELITPRLRVIVQKRDLSVYFINKKGDTLSAAKNYQVLSDGLKVNFTTTLDEAIYGGGFKGIDLNKRGTVLENYNQAHGGYKFGQTDLNIAIPFLLSNRGYGLYLDNHARSWFDVAKTKADQIDFTTTAGTIRFYFISGNSMGDVLANYTQLTGHQPLPPRWAMGYISSRYGYKSETEITNVVDQIQQAGIPVDAVVFDLYWYKSKLFMGNQNWSHDSFPNPQRMLGNLRKRGVRVIPISETYITRQSENFNYANNHHLFAQNKFDTAQPFIFEKFWTGAPTGLLDMFKPEAQQFYWNMYRQRIKEGISGWWFDLAEPELVNDSIKFSLGNDNEVHNIYPLAWAKTAFDGYRKDFPGSRIFTLIRSGSAGMQRYSTFPWTGDVSRTFEGLQAQVPSMVNMGLGGVGYMHSDAGGFTGAMTKDAELYSRWLEFAAFTPIMRTHASTRAPGYAPEPIHWDSATRLRVTRYIKLRYQLLPYNYTMAYNNTINGRPLMMPVNYFEENNRRLNNINDEYLWGEHILVAPVVTKGETTKKVLFPDGDWIGFYNLESYRDSAEVNAPIDSLPIFVKAGSIIPMSAEIMNTDQYNGKELLLKYYGGTGGGNVKSEWFYDNGKDPHSLASGQYELVRFTTNRKGKEDHIDIAGVHVTGRKTQFHLQVMGKRIRSVRFSKAVSYKISGNSSVDFEWTGRPVELTIQSY